jgi:predicted nucleotidyltransferase
VHSRQERLDARFQARELRQRMAHAYDVSMKRGWRWIVGRASPTSGLLPATEVRCYAVAVAAPVQDDEQTVERLARCEREIRALGVTRLALFGSVARGEPRADSDVDILVQFGPGAKSYGRFLALSELLEAELGRRVELVTTEALSPFIGPRILAEAQDVLRAA